MVAATDERDGRWERTSKASNYGLGVDIAAPGSNILRTGPDNQYLSASGTSLASPNAAGVAALIWSYWSDKSQQQGGKPWTRDMVVAQLVATADSIDDVPGNQRFEDLLGSGRINAYRALTIDPSDPSVDDPNKFPWPEVARVEKTLNAAGEPNGFRLFFNQVLDPKTVTDASNYKVSGPAGQDVSFTLSDYAIADNFLQISCGGPRLTPGEYTIEIASDIQNPFEIPLMHNRQREDGANVYVANIKVFAAEGYTGDVVKVDLQALFGPGAYFLGDFLPLASGAVVRTTEREDGLFLEAVLDDVTQPLGTILRSEQVEGIGSNFSTTGRLYFLPDISSESSVPAAAPLDGNAAPGFQGILRGRVNVDNKDYDYVIRVQDGYSIQGDAAVGFSASVLDILSLQQRLAYLGFTDVDGSRLMPTGTYQEGTRHAVDVFNSAVRAPTFTSGVSEIDKTFINLAEAPRWINLATEFAAHGLPTDMGVNIAELSEESWATDWAAQVFRAAGAKLPVDRSLILLRASSIYGSLSVSDLVNRPNGIDVDVKTLDGSLFYRTKQLADPANPNDHKLCLVAQGDQNIVFRIEGRNAKLKESTSNEVVFSDLPQLPQDLLDALQANRKVFLALRESESLPPQVREVSRLETNIEGDVVAVVNAPFDFQFTFVERYAFFYSDVEAKVGDEHALAHPTDNEGNPATLSEFELAGIAGLIVDTEQYDLERVRDQIAALFDARTPSGATVKSVLYDDPRTWDLGKGNVKYSGNTANHFRVQIAPPVTDRILSSEMKERLLRGSAELSRLFSEPLASADVAEMSLPMLGDIALKDLFSVSDSVRGSLENPIAEYLNSVERTHG